MPQASEETRAQMLKWFGDGVSDDGAMEFLRARGWVLTPSWEWCPPVPAHSMSCYEHFCIRFLVEEWDFGDVTRSWRGELVCLCGNLPQINMED